MRIHSLLSPKCVIKPSVINGSGVFAAKPFSVGEMVAVWGGTVYTEDECRRFADALPQFQTHTIGVAPGFYFGSNNLFELDDAELFNHSCNPNIGVRGQIILVARRAIETGEELTFDYETVDPNPGGFSCRCGSANCRGTIDGTAWKDAKFLAENTGNLSYYIEQMIARNSE